VNELLFFNVLVDGPSTQLEKRFIAGHVVTNKVLIGVIFPSVRALLGSQRSHNSNHRQIRARLLSAPIAAAPAPQTDTIQGSNRRVSSAELLSDRPVTFLCYIPWTAALMFFDRMTSFTASPPTSALTAFPNGTAEKVGQCDPNWLVTCCETCAPPCRHVWILRDSRDRSLPWLKFRDERLVRAPIDQFATMIKQGQSRAIGASEPTVSRIESAVRRG
jgi:hypothetical protein